MPEDWLGDTDKDELFDIYEKVIDTDPLNPDTDGDGLPDGYEVITLNTDPLEVDTDENGISDADEDFDSDNLNNLGEYKNKTEPYNPDTDDDGFLDGDEISKYKTDPLNPDTDNDGLLDGEESYDGSIYAKYGIYFDPLNPDTNGNGILDGEEVFGQSKKQEVSTHDEAITEIKVDMDTNGNLERNLTIESMYNVDAMSTNVYALIGEPFNFETPTSFSSATITFKIDKSKLGDTKFDNLIILWYNEEEQIFEEMDTIHDEVNSTVSTTTTHFSQYMIVDSEKWFDNWEESFVQLRKMWSGNTSYYKALNTILIVDCSWKMESADKISYSIEVGYNGVTEDNYQSIISDMDSPSDVEYCLKKYGRRICQRTSICENIINNMGSGDRAAIITYSSGIESNSGLISNYGSLISYAQNVNNDGGSMYLSDAVSTALSYVTDDVENTYRIVIVTSGRVNYGSSLSAFDYSNVSLNIVSLGGGSISSGIESIAQSTGGDVYYGYPSSSLTGASGSSVTIPPQFIGEDSDGDGIPDLVELYGLKPNGQPINSDPHNKHSDNDGLEDNEELHFSKDKMTYELDKTQYDGSVFVWSDPCLEDTDGDGVWDNEDPLKLRYGISSKLNYDYKENLYQELNVYIDSDFDFIKKYKNVGHYTTKDCIDIIYEYDDLITKLSNEYMLPKAAIQAILMRELRCVDLTDDLKDISVNNYFLNQHQIEEYQEASILEQILMGPQLPYVVTAEDSSTGYGQIFAYTAIKSINWAVNNHIISDIEYEYDYNNWKDREYIWNKLKNDNEYNISIIAIVLMWGMNDELCKMQTSDRSYWKFTDEQIKAMLTRYNGYDENAIEYGNQVYNYYSVFDNYNKLSLQ